MKNELEQIYQTVGRHEDTLFSHTLEGFEGKKKINAIMTKFRSNPPQEIQILKVKAIEDYLTSEVYHLDKDTTSQINSPNQMLFVSYLTKDLSLYVLLVLNLKLNYMCR